MRENLKKGSIYIISIVFVVVAFLGLKNKNDEFYLNIYYSDGAPDVTQVFLDRGNGYSEECSYTSAVVNKTVQIPLKDISEAIAVRVDLGNSAGDVKIEKISLKKLGITVKSYESDEIQESIILLQNIGEIYADDNCLMIKCTSNDPYMIMSENFLMELKNARKNVIPIILCIMPLVLFEVIFIIFKDKIKSIVCKIVNKAYDNVEKYGNIYVAFTLVAITFIIYGAYIFGKKYFIFKDIASDSFYQTYAYAYYYAKAFQEGNMLDMWNSFIGLGKRADLLYYNIFNWIYYFGTENIEYLTGISQVLKVLLSGWFFYLYMRTMEKTKITSAVCGIFYAFCGHMVLRGSWMNYPNEVCAVAFWLFCFERYNKKRKILLLPIATAIVLSSFSGYYVVLYSGVFFVYAVFRYSCENKMELKEFARYMLNFGLCYLLALGIANIPITEAFSTILRNSRLENSVNAVRTTEMPLLGEENLAVLCSAFYRTIGIDIIGSVSNYVGRWNMLADGTFYCGILSLLVIPYGILDENKKKRIWYILAWSAAMAYIIIPKVRTIISGFQSGHFKISSLWVIVLMLFLAAEGLEKILKKENINLKLLYAISGIYVMLVVLIQLIFKLDIYYDRLLVSAIFACMYIIFIICYVKRQVKRKNFVFEIYLLAGIEVSLLCYNVVNDRGCLTPEVKNQKVFYNDYTNEAIEYIKTIDDSAFYRIDKQFDSVCLNDSWVQGYNGIKLYLGGTELSGNIREYVEVFALPHYENVKECLCGYAGIPQMNDFVSAKYILTKQPCIDVGYNYVNQIGDIYIYENPNVKTLGSVYYSTVSESELLNYNVSERRNIIMNNVVLDDEYVDIHTEDICNEPAYEEVEVHQTQVGSYELSGINKDDVISISVQGITTASGTNNYLSVYEGEELLYKNLLNFGEKKTECNFILTNIKADKIELNLSKYVKAIDVNVKKISSSKYQKWYEEVNSNTTELEVESFSNDNISGKYLSDKDGILALSIPYDKGWKIYIDGEEKEVINANIGFIGAYVEAGDHQVLIEYERPNLKIKLVIMFISFTMYGTMSVVVCIKSKKRRRD